LRGLEHVAANQRGYVVANTGNGMTRSWFSEDLITWSEGYDFEGELVDIVVHEGRFIALMAAEDRE
jgi:hypothetical protein